MGNSGAWGTQMEQANRAGKSTAIDGRQIGRSSAGERGRASGPAILATREVLRSSPCTERAGQVEGAERGFRRLPVVDRQIAATSPAKLPRRQPFGLGESELAVAGDAEFGPVGRQGQYADGGTGRLAAAPLGQRILQARDQAKGPRRQARHLSPAAWYKDSVGGNQFTPNDRPPSAAFR